MYPRNPSFSICLLIPSILNMLCDMRYTHRVSIMDDIIPPIITFMCRILYIPVSKNGIKADSDMDPPMITKKKSFEGYSPASKH